MDMVCEKNNDVLSFRNDPFQLTLMAMGQAKGTTLGADEGIGMAIALALIGRPKP